MIYRVCKLTGLVWVFTFILLTPLFGQHSACQQFSGLRKFSESYMVGQDEKTDGNGIHYLDMSRIRQKGNREFPYPIKGHQLITNPPVFTWPMADYKYPESFPVEIHEKELDAFLRYDFRIGRTKDFSDKESFVVTDLRLPFYNNHKAFQPGTWYWRYRVAGKEWSDLFEADIPEHTRKFESPRADEAYNMIPIQHPRIFRMRYPEKCPTADQENLMKIYKSKADVALTKEVTYYEVKGKPIPETASPAEKLQINKFRLRYEIEGLNSDIINLLNAFQLSNDKNYLKKAVAFADYIASKDPVGMYKAADFTGGKSMSTLAMVYDVAYDYLSFTQKETYQSFIVKVAPLIISHAMQENVGSADGILCAHFFQHTFYDAFISAIIMKEHIPEAEKWFNMLYNIWLSRTPGGGFLADGVWPNGNIGYIHVNMESMVNNYILYQDLFNVNLFTHPWYENCANALAYTIPIRSAGDGFGDGCEDWSEPNKTRAGFAYILGQELNNPFAVNYAYEISGRSSDKPFFFDNTTFAGYRFRYQPRPMQPVDRKNIPQSLVFPHTGIVVMNTDVLHAEKNLFLSFFSSPFGVGSHGLAEQNSFNIVYKGKPLFYPTGYRITTRDKHYLLAQKHSRARNTVTVDGKTQAFSSDGYGRIARYLDGESMSYTMGDASKAYARLDHASMNWITVLNNEQIYKPEHGFILNDEDDPKVKKFRRHLVMLRPDIIVIYDELESEKNVTWTFQLNGPERANMKIDTENQSLVADTDNCDARVRVFGSSAVTMSLIDTSYVRPFDWLNPQRGRPAKTFEPHQYHYKVENVRKCRKMRFLTVIQVDGSNAMSFAEVKPDGNDCITIGNYRIKGQLDTIQDARLEIENKATGEYLLYGPTEGSSKAISRKFSHSTLLISNSNGLKESIDRYPLMVPEQAKNEP